VTAVRRTATVDPELQRLGVDFVACDLADPRSAARVADDVEGIVACQAAGGGGEAAYRAAYVDANGTLLAAARRVGARAFVYTGSTGVFGQHDGSDVDELTPPAPASPTAELLLEAERLVLSSPGDERGPRCSVVRLSGLYGPGRAGVIERVRAGAMALGPGDDAWTNWCHHDDAVAFVLAALERGRHGASYHGSDAHPARRREVVQWIVARLGIPAPRSETLSGGRQANRRILSERTRAELGVTLRYPSFADGLLPLMELDSA
jgi:nucleoside-diphosphate-sugar epimerase